jgi:galactokinase
MDPAGKVTGVFREVFGTSPAHLVRAPGRVNLIGEHTDYNDGFVMPMAIDRAVWIALQPRDDEEVRAYSVDFAESARFRIPALAAGQTPAGAGHWSEYLKGIAWTMREAGHKLRGWDGVVAGDVPIGAGLSSSAALEMATARTFAVVSGLTWDPASMARLGQRAENHWVGMNCGIMDQIISAAGRAGHALLIDCRSLETQAVPLPPATAVVVLDTATRRSLVGSAYNERRDQCEAAARFFGVPALRDVSLAEFNRRAGGLDDPARKRARHVIGENERTVEAAAAMRRGDAVGVGRLMGQSHDSLRDDFEVCNRELNVMVDCAGAADGCFGARMTGAGFGGCAVALVLESTVADFVATVSRAYEKATGLTPHVYVCQATDGAEVVATKPSR